MNDLKLKKIFSKILDVEVNEINDQIEYNKMKNWDSIGHMAIVAAIDNEFDIILDTEDIIGMNSFKRVKEILTKYNVIF